MSRHFDLSKAFQRSFRDALIHIKSSRESVKEYFSGPVDLERLRRQGELRRDWYLKGPQHNNQIEEEIADLIFAMDAYEELEERYRDLPPSSKSRNDLLELRIMINTHTAGRLELELEASAESLKRRLEEKLLKSGKPITVWKNEHGYTEYFNERLRVGTISRLKNLKEKIWAELQHRQSELIELYRSSLHGIR
jgi:hypothetical protein